MYIYKCLRLSRSGRRWCAAHFIWIQALSRIADPPAHQGEPPFPAPTWRSDGSSHSLSTRGFIFNLEWEHGLRNWEKWAKTYSSFIFTWVNTVFRQRRSLSASGSQRQGLLLTLGSLIIEPREPLTRWMCVGRQDRAYRETNTSPQLNRIDLIM